MSIRYMIHGCPKRAWYIDEFMLPELKRQGISDDEVMVWMDTEGLGNLKSFVKSMEWVAENCDPEEGIWHIQDDVLPSDTFAERTRAFDAESNAVCYGFCNNIFDGGAVNYIGWQKSRFSWHSFQCIRIPNAYAAEFGPWFNDSFTQKFWAKHIEQNKNDDEIFKEFLHRNHYGEKLLNMMPCLVDHIDYMLGGTTINYGRQEKGDPRRPAYWWDEKEKTAALAAKIAEREKRGSGDAERAKSRASGRSKRKAQDKP